VVFHDAANDDKRTVDVALQGADYGRHRRQALAERRGEDLRLAYVALTRARNQVVLWWAGSSDSRDSPLGRLLFARDGEGNVASSGDGTPADDEAVARLHELAAAAPGCVSVETARLSDPVHWSPQLHGDDDLTVATLDRGLDRTWRRTSYSDLTAAAHDEALVASEPEEPLLADEPDQPATASLLGEMPMGADVGTLVHRVLQDTDFAAPALEAELERNIAVAQAWRATDIGDPAQLAVGLAAMLRSPLGPLVGDARLRDVARADRLDELRFELPLAGGDEPRGDVTIAAVAGALRDHLPAGDPLAGYAQRLADPALRATVRGYLNGSLDLVMRLPGPRYAVVDYKTNRLGSPERPLTARDYTPALLAAEMNQRHYGLQAILYTVALHRYLRWRVPDYDPDRDLAGVLYLFVRGMSGPATPLVDGGRCGVFGWRPSGALTGRLSEILDASATS
jgi:exodeoxyribonuclease V beta subunit